MNMMTINRPSVGETSLVPTIQRVKELGRRFSLATAKVRP